MGHWVLVLVNKMAEAAGRTWRQLEHILLSVANSVDISQTFRDMDPRSEI